MEVISINGYYLLWLNGTPPPHIQRQKPTKYWCCGGGGCNYRWWLHSLLGCLPANLVDHSMNQSVEWNGPWVWSFTAVLMFLCIRHQGATVSNPACSALTRTWLSWSSLLRLQTSMECCLYLTGWLPVSSCQTSGMSEQNVWSEDILSREGFILETTNDDCLSWQANYSEVFSDRSGDCYIWILKCYE